jgi:hypothetical protein
MDKIDNHLPYFRHRDRFIISIRAALWYDERIVNFVVRSLAMSAFPSLNDQQWLRLLEQVAKCFNEVTLSRGFQYFKQQRIDSLRLTDSGLVQARVTGTENYTVRLNLLKLDHSSCSCPVESTCKHMAATIMELGDRWGYPASQVVNAKSHLKQLAAGSLSASRLKQLSGMDVFGWHTFLDTYTAQVRPGYDQAAWVNMLRQQLQHLRKASIAFSETERIYFELHLELFILRKMKEQAAIGGGYFTSFTQYGVYDEIVAWLQQQAERFNFSLDESRLEQTFAYLRRQMAESSRYDPHDLHYQLYLSLWKYGAAPHLPLGADNGINWIERELRAIEEHLSGSDDGRFLFLAAKAFLYLQQARSSEAWAVLETAGMIQGSEASLFFPHFQHLSDSGDWAHLADWLVRTAPCFLDQASRYGQEFDAFMAFWKNLIVHRPEAESQLWPLLEERLPRTSRIIENLVYEQRKWKTWLELQIVEQRDPLSYRVSVFQPIEKEAPELLLPYYHQAIERYVRLKNRHDYKLAVKLLKRNQKVYKKLKQTERWTRFLAEFTERHSRLRALQEEMRKGKLLE